MKYKIFANHAHVFPSESKPQGTVEKLLELMEVCEIDKAVCFAPFHGHYEYFGLKGEPNEFLAEKLTGKNNLYGFGTVNTDTDDIEEQIERIISYGFKGIKLHPAYQEFNLLGEKAQRIYKKAEENNLFLSFHTGVHWHRIADYNMLMYDEIAYKFPRLRFSMEHLGGYHFFREGLAVMVNNSRNDVRNTFAGWTSIAMGEKGLFDEWSHSDDELRTLIYQTDHENHIFGLDFPYKGIDYTKNAIERILNLDIPEDAKEKILGVNLARELGVEL